MENMTENAPVPIVETFPAPDIYSDGVIGWSLLNGNIRLTLVSTRVNHMSSPGPASQVVVARLIMAEVQAEIMARGLLEFIETQRTKQGAPPPTTFSVQ
jgi:hypothetical protein